MTGDKKWRNEYVYIHTNTVLSSTSTNTSISFDDSAIVNAILFAVNLTQKIAITQTCNVKIF